ncbi:MAG: sulfurtransferase TusA family protein [Gammaproteobacteria bacterium]|jgi:TusA-related sulfurtransferase|nr:sulfurtransferase TusA family protein [Gammaproteobacteria bacterium]
MFLIRKQPAAATSDPAAAPHLRQCLELDVCGQLCPSTLLTALKAVNERQGELRNGEVSLRFKTDNRDSITTIPDAVRNMGYAVSIEKQQGHYVIEVTADARRGPLGS